MVAAVVTFYLLRRATLPALEVPASGRFRDAWRLLTDQAAFGWKDLLTTLPPVDGDGPLLVLPWPLGLRRRIGRDGVDPHPVGSRAGCAPFSPCCVPVALSARSSCSACAIPQSLLVQGVAVRRSVCWPGSRCAGSALPRQVAGSTGRLGRSAVAASLLVLAAQRVDAGRALARRRRRSSPWSAQLGRAAVRHRPVPLSAGVVPQLRRCPRTRRPENLYEHELFTIEGVEPGTRVRFATLDRYDGMVWGASNNAIPGAADDTYPAGLVHDRQPRPGDAGRGRPSPSTRATPASGCRWSARSSRCLRPRATSPAKSDFFRYNLATSTAVVPTGINPGDRYSFTAVIPPDDALTPPSVPGGPVGPAAEAAAFLDAQADRVVEESPSRR